MTKTDALTALRAILGPKLRYREEKARTSPEARQEAGTRRQEAADRYRDLDAERARRRDLLLAQDEEYQRLNTEAIAARKARDEAAREASRYRLTVGTVDTVGGLGMFFVEASGDNWQEVVDKVKAERARRAARMGRTS